MQDRRFASMKRFCIQQNVAGPSLTRCNWRSAEAQAIHGPTLSGEISQSGWAIFRTNSHCFAATYSSTQTARTSINSLPPHLDLFEFNGCLIHQPTP